MDWMNLFNGVREYGAEIAVQFFLVMAAIGGLLAAFQGLISFIAPFTPWKWDDNLARVLGELLKKKIFQKKQ